MKSAGSSIELVARILSAVLLLGGALGSRGLAEVTAVSVAVDGLACPFCVHGVDKKLKAVEGVEEVVVDLKTGVATLVLGDGVTPDVAALREAVKKAGYTPRAVTLRAVGTLGATGDWLVLDVRGTDARYRLFEPGHENGPPFFEPALFRELSAWQASHALVAVTGSVHVHSDGEPALAADSVARIHVLSFRVDGMSCQDCAARLTRLLVEAPGVDHAVVDFGTRRATVQLDAEAVDPKGIIAVIEEAGFHAAATQEAP